jgi:hemoglobin
MLKKDVTDRSDIEDIVARFYNAMLKDPIVGFIFTDVAKIQLDQHLPIIVDFWSDSLFRESNYTGNPLQAHMDIHQKIPLRPGHFTRWLFLFEKAVNESHDGVNARRMIDRAELVAKSISAALVKSKRGEMNLVLPKD